MRRDLSRHFTQPVAPPGVDLVPFTERVAPACRDLLNAAYAHGFGDVVPFAPWWTSLTSDSEYDPALCFVASADGAPIGFCQCWTSAFVKDVAVAEAARRGGIGTFLLSHAMHVFARRNAGHLDLKTDVENVKAQSLYRRLGFVILERIETT